MWLLSARQTFSHHNFLSFFVSFGKKRFIKNVWSAFITNEKIMYRVKPQASNNVSGKIRFHLCFTFQLVERKPHQMFSGQDHIPD